ncbi:MAG: cell wall hydrolase [Candidatus Omnitrophica bacterium]|nr:cell wall hydrolase [Candidatus Omnitrophota bacterium]
MNRPMPMEGVWEAILLTEAAGEPYQGKVGVAEVLRNRGWDPKGFVGIRRRDLQRFLSEQPQWAHAQARRALRQARAGSNLTRRATHFENVELFGTPSWARRMEKTARIGRLTFFREKVGDSLM